MSSGGPSGTDPAAPERERLREEADHRLGEALETRDVHDPREVCRHHLRQLRSASSERYGEAVEYYETVLLPAVASGERDPVAAWVEYAGRLAALRGPGRTVAVDATGAAEPREDPDPASALVLHLPQGKEGGAGGGALLVAMPAELSAAQQATYDLLVAGKKQWEGPDPEGPPPDPDERSDEV